jgi:Chalcone isomerase-like
MKTLRILSLAVLLSYAAGSRAAECLGVTMPDQFELDGKTLVLNGLGARLATMLKVKVYVAGLYLEDHSHDAAAIIGSDQPRHLVLKFVRGVSKDEITDAWTDGFKKNAPDYASLAARVATLNDAMTDLADGSTLTFSYVPGRGTTVDIDGAQKATIAGADFASALIAIWLGKPPNKEVKVGLLGGDCD